MKAQYVIVVILLIVIIDSILIAMLFNQRKQSEEQNAIAPQISPTIAPLEKSNELINNSLNGTVQSINTIPGSDDLRIKVTNDDYKDGIYFRIVKDAENEQLAVKAQTSLGYWNPEIDANDPVQNDQLEFIGTAGTKAAASIIDSFPTKPMVHVKYRTCVPRTLDACNIDSQRSIYALGIFIQK